MWSCGCILAEMLGRSPLFPGKNFVHQLQLVFDIIGSPENREVSHINNSEALKFLASQHGKKKIPFSRIYPDAPTDAWQLLDDLLVFDPRKRLDVDQALQCPYLFGVGQPESQVYPTVSKEFEFNFEHMKVTKNQLKKLIQQEAQSLRREKNLINDSQANVNTKVIPSFERVQTVGSTDSDSRKETAKKANTEHTEVRAKAKYDNDDVSVTSNRSGRSNSSGRTGYSQRVTSNTANKQSAATLAAQNDCTNRRYSGLMQNTASSALRAASAPRSRLSGVGTKIPTTATRPASNLRQHPGNSDKSQGKQLTENDKGPIKQSSHEQKMETKEATEVTEDSNSVRKSRVGIAYVSVTPKIEQSKSSYVSHERSSKQERENTGTKASDSDEGDAIDSASVYSQHSAGTAGTNATSDRQLRSSKNKLSHVSHRDGVGSPERKSLIQTYMSPTRVVGARNNFEDIQLENNIPELTKTLANAVLSPARDNSSPSAVQPPLPVPNSFAWKVSLVDSNKESELVGMNRVEVSDKELEAIKKSPGRKLVLPYGSPLRRKSTNDQVSANVLPMPPSEVARPLPVPEDQPDRPENATIKKRIITVPKSPKFSLMSWQRKHLGENEHEKVNRSELPKRSSSASRGAYTSTAKANASKPLEKRRSMRLPNGSSRGEGVEQARKMSEKNTKENQELNRRNGAEMYEEAKDSEWNMKKVEELLKGDNNGRRRQAGRAAGVADYNDTASHYSANSRSSSAARTRKK